MVGWIQQHSGAPSDPAGPSTALSSPSPPSVGHGSPHSQHPSPQMSTLRHSLQRDVNSSPSTGSESENFAGVGAGCNTYSQAMQQGQLPYPIYSPSNSANTTPNLSSRPTRTPRRSSSIITPSPLLPQASQAHSPPDKESPTTPSSNRTSTTAFRHVIHPISSPPLSMHKSLPSVNTHPAAVPISHTRGRTPSSPRHHEMPRPPLSPIPSGYATSPHSRPEIREIVSPVPQRRYLDQALRDEARREEEQEIIDLQPPSRRTDLREASGSRERPSSFYDAVEIQEQQQDSFSSSPSSSASFMKPPLPQARNLETSQPRISSFYGSMDGNRNRSDDEPQASRSYLDQKPGPRYTATPPSILPDATAAKGPANSAPSSLQTFKTNGQPAMSRALPQPRSNDVSRRSSFYGIDAGTPATDLYQTQPRSQAPSPDGTSTRSRSEGRRSPRSSLHALQPVSRVSTNHSYSTRQLQQEYALQGQPAQRGRKTSWTTQSNPSSVYGLNAISANLNSGGSGSGSGGDLSSLAGAPPVPLLSHTHLHPGDRASLLSHQKTLEAYRSNIRKTNDPEVTYEFAIFMLGIAKEMGSASGAADGGWSTQPSEENLLSSMNDHSGSPSPDPSISLNSRSSGSSGDLHASASAGYALGAGIASGPVPSSSFNWPKIRTSHSPAAASTSSHLLTRVQSNSLSSSPTRTSGPNDRRALISEVMALLKRNADRGHAPSQYFLARCYSQGIGTRRSSSGMMAKETVAAIEEKSDTATLNVPAAATAVESIGTGRPDYDRALLLFTAAAKHGHVASCYRTGQCHENGWGCRKDAAKAVQFYTKAAVSSHPAAMYRLGMAELNGELGLTGRQKEGFKWLKRVAELAELSESTDTLLSSDDPMSEAGTARMCAVKALHELALLHERGIENVVFVDNEYAAELLARASELGYASSAYKLGECYEYGSMGCPQDSALSIHYYNIAAQQNHKEACFALTAWYLVGSPGVLPQSDTEAYLWARRAAEQGLAKAEYAVGYFIEVGIGTLRDEPEAIGWFRRAAEHGDKRANTRLRTLTNGAGAGAGAAPETHPSHSNPPSSSHPAASSGPGSGPRASSVIVQGQIKKSRRRGSSVQSSGHASLGKGTGRKSEGDCLVM